MDRKVSGIISVAGTLAVADALNAHMEIPVLSTYVTAVVAGSIEVVVGTSTRAQHVEREHYETVEDVPVGNIALTLVSKAIRALINRINSYQIFRSENTHLENIVDDATPTKIQHSLGITQACIANHLIFLTRVVPNSTGKASCVAQQTYLED